MVLPTDIEMEDMDAVQQQESDPGDEDREYDPHAHREIESPISSWTALLMLLRSTLGVGILIMPKAFVSAGYIEGTIGTVLIGIMCTYYVSKLLKSSHELCKRLRVPYLTYAATAEAALLAGPDFLKPLAPYAVYTVNTFQLLLQVGSTSVNVIIITINILQLVNMYLGIHLSNFLVKTSILILVICLNSSRKLKYLDLITAVGDTVAVIGFLILVGTNFFGKTSPEFITPFENENKLPSFFGNMLYGLKAASVALSIESRMKTPKAFRGKFGICNCAMFSVIVFYVTMGIIGYLLHHGEPVSEIDLSLVSPQETIALALLNVGLFIAHVGGCYFVNDLIENDYIAARLQNSTRGNIWAYILNIGMVTICCVVASLIPHVQLIVQLCGTLCLSILGFIFPAVIHICTYWQLGTPRKRILLIIKDSIVIIIGCSWLIIGTSTSFMTIVKSSHMNGLGRMELPHVYYNTTKISNRYWYTPTVID